MGIWPKGTTLMKISTILDHIDSGHMALPEFQAPREAWSDR